MSASLWRDRQFRIFWSAQAVSEFGDRVTELALPLIAVTLLDASPGEVGLLTAAVWLPNLASLFIGTWVDERGDKRPLMIAADLSRTVVLLSLPAAYWLDVLTIGHLYAIAILAGTAHVVFNTPTRRSFRASCRRTSSWRPTASSRRPARSRSWPAPRSAAP